MKLGVVVLFALGGCRSILGIDGATVDEALGNDEDNDTVRDFEDNCPTQPNVDQRDGDSDDVGDACDPSDGGVNRIAFYSAMLDESGLVLGSNTAIGDGYAAIRSSQIAVMMSVQPVRIEATLAFRTFAPSQQLGIEFDGGGPNVWTCYAGFAIGSCGGIDCLRLKVPGSNLVSVNFDEAEMLAKLTVELRSTGATSCVGTAGMLVKPVNATGPLPPPGTVTISATGDAEVENLIVYE